MTALLSEIFVFLDSAASELRSASYASKHVSWTLSCAPFCATCTTTLLLSNDCSTVRIILSGLELYVRYDWQVMEPNALQPLQCILCIFTCISWKLLVIYGRCTYWTTALLLKMSIFCVETGCKIRFLSYGSQHSSQFLSDKHFVRPYTHNLKNTGHTWYSAYQTTALLFETFLVWFRVAWKVQLESYGHRHAWVFFWCKILCRNSKPVI